MQFFKSVSLVAAIGFTAVLAAPVARFTGCADLEGIPQPYDTKNASNVLPGPSAGLKLVRLAIGVGSQNYTCATSDASSMPQPNGAIAILYDATCAPQSVDGARNTGLLDSFPPILVQTPPTVEALGVRAFTQTFQSQLTVGVHYFKDTKSPVFDFRQRGGSQIFVGSAASRMPAPVGSSAGRAPDAHGAVPWLKLAQNAAGGSNGIQEAYRLVTAGGSAPATCDGQEANFEIPYAAEYWFYN